MTSEPQPHKDGGNVMVVRPDGDLDKASVPALRERAFQEILGATGGGGRWQGLAVDGSGVTRIDGVGLGFLAELRCLALERFGKPLVITGLSTDLEHLCMAAALADASAGQLRPVRRVGTIERMGAGMALLGRDARAMLLFVGELLDAFRVVARHPRQVRWGEFLETAQEVGADALLILAMLGLLLGAILAFQTAVPLDRFGAVQLIPTIVGIAILRELGPLIAAVLVAGRTGAAFAAELGTMKVTEELSALRVMGLNPMAFLVVPRVLATVLMLPVLAVYTDLMGVLGGFIVMKSRGYSLVQYMESVRSGVTLQDAAGGIIKTFVFALLIASAGCERGLATGPGPGAVGRSATRAVVSSIVLIIFADEIFGLIFYTLGV
ncbi:MAG TPA: MlaE family lipid ABC transporter permease subunit [Phycisphaerae bacterium]|nr:MlaE family lipid ABC transporter permease subunit [Phycisphaerae bacterium]